MSRVPFAVLILASAAACAPVDGVRPERADAARGDQCFSAQLARTFRPVGKEAVDVEISRNRVFRLSLGAGCFDIDWANSVALRSRGGGSFICSANDAELIVPSAMGPDRCQVTGIRRLTEAEIQARRRD